jgi:hypothetical protein
VTGAGTESKPKRHHYVPRWHLRRFAVDPAKARVARYSKSADTHLLLPVENAAVIGQYYTWHRDGEADTTVEEGLAMIDGRASEVLPKLERGDDLVDTEPNVVAGYLALLHGRVPPMRDGLQNVIETFGALQAEMMFANATPEERQARIEDARKRGLADTEDEYDVLEARIIEQIRNREMKVTMDHIATMGLAAMGAERSIPIIEQMSWMVIEAPPGSEFVISDNPIVVYSESTTSYMGAGYLTPDVEVTMPLSRKHLFLASHLHSFQGRCCVTADAVDHFNSRTWVRAQDYIFASSREVLERVEASLAPDVRRRPGGGIEITGG